jgi:hypothetical protein
MERLVRYRPRPGPLPSPRLPRPRDAPDGPERPADRGDGAFDPRRIEPPEVGRERDVDGGRYAADDRPLEPREELAERERLLGAGRLLGVGRAERLLGAKRLLGVERVAGLLGVKRLLGIERADRPKVGWLRLAGATAVSRRGGDGCEREPVRELNGKLGDVGRRVVTFGALDERRASLSELRAVPARSPGRLRVLGDGELLLRAPNRGEKVVEGVVRPVLGWRRTRGDGVGEGRVTADDRARSELVLPVDRPPESDSRIRDSSVDRRLPGEGASEPTRLVREASRPPPPPRLAGCEVPGVVGRRTLVRFSLPAVRRLLLAVGNWGRGERG